MAVQAMKEGALEFIQKPFRDQDLIDRINHALIQDTQNRSALARRAEVLHRVESLTPRERQVMDLVVEGAANKVIAIDLGLSERTVEVHRAKVMEKMGSRSVAHLVKLQLTLAQEI
jgi:FixJ family two-component response regulator